MEAAVQERIDKAVANIRQQVDERHWIDIGLGAEKLIGETRELLAAAVTALEAEGYQKFSLRVKSSRKNWVIVKVLGRPGSTDKECYLNRDHISALLPA